MTTFGTMRARIARELGDPDDARWTNEIEQAIIDAIERFEEEKFYFSQDKYVQAADVTSTTTASEEYVSWPTSPALFRLDMLRILPAGGSEPYALKREHWETIERAATPASLSTGIPFRYAVRAERVRLDPIPNDTHTLYWAGLFKPTTTLTTSSADGATNIWMTKGARLIRNHAKETVARDDLKNGSIASAALAVWMDELDELRTKTTRRLRTGFNRPVGPGHYRSRNRM